MAPIMKEAMRHIVGLEAGGKPDDITVIVAQILTKNKDYSVWLAIFWILSLNKYIS